MAKGSNPNNTSDPYPRGFDANKVRNEVDPVVDGAQEKHESAIAGLDRSAGSEKGGR